MHKSWIGKFIPQTTTEEHYQAYIPPQLPLNPPLQLDALYPYLERATRSLALLNGVAQTIPNTSLFIYMYVRKEALLSSQIEGTQSSFSDLILFENDQRPNISVEDVEEVSNYVAAINYGLERIKNGFPLSLRLLRDIHSVLLRGGRGKRHAPGEFRRSQNWIGGTRPGTALFVPPPPEKLMAALDNFEKFLHLPSSCLPLLIKAGIAHVQFESIHPFLDGNGRLGRLLITLLLSEGGILDAPILYLSLYLKENRSTYYRLLQEVRTDGRWETWLEFFLDGIDKSAQQALLTVRTINEIFQEDLRKIQTLKRARFSCVDAFTLLQKLPQLSVPLLADMLQISAPTARSALNHLLDLKIVDEISGKQRDKIYVYRKYLKILELGTEPL